MDEQGVEDRIMTTLAELAVERGFVGRVEPHLSLTDDLGFDSLGLAQLVATLELDLGFDPFETEPFAGVRTVTDLIQTYRRGARSGAASGANAG